MNKHFFTVYDATVKSGSGLEYGISHQFGHFDECLELNQPKFQALHNKDTPIHSKYCLTSVQLEALTVRNTALRYKKVSLTHTYSSFYLEIVNRLWHLCILPMKCYLNNEQRLKI